MMLMAQGSLPAKSTTALVTTLVNYARLRIQYKYSNA
jgi:hypothetical protein